MPKINIDKGKVAAIGNPLSMIIADAWVEYQGNRVTVVPEGMSFVAKAEYAATYPEAKITQYYSLCITVVGDGVANWDITRVLGINKTPSGKMTLDNLGGNIMPSHDITLRFRPWGHAEYKLEPPPRGEW